MNEEVDLHSEFKFSSSSYQDGFIRSNLSSHSWATEADPNRYGNFEDEIYAGLNFTLP